MCVAVARRVLSRVCFLDHTLTISAKYAVLEPHNRRKKGMSTEKRIAAMGVEEDDDRPFVDKAATQKVLGIPLNTAGC